MNCSPKTMIRFGAAIGIGLTAVYLAFPEAREFVVAGAPILLALICPVSMIVMMFVMKSNGRRKNSTEQMPPASLAKASEAASSAA